MKISKLTDISKNFEKKTLVSMKKGCKFAASNKENKSNQLKSTTMNKEQMNDYYRQASKMANILYNYMVEIFKKMPCVVYCIETARWHNHVTVDVWINVGNGFATDDVCEMVGSVSLSYSLAPWRHEKASDFIQQVKDETNAFLRKVIMQGLTEQEQ